MKFSPCRLRACFIRHGARNRDAGPLGRSGGCVNAGVLGHLAAAICAGRVGDYRSSVGTRPATVTRLPGITSAPVVVIAHGFAGSRPLMEGFALTLARAGYIVVSYDLAGHDRNPVPMSGDVSVVTGTTHVLMDELGRVSDAALALPGAHGRLALLGHSMASDIVVREAARDRRVRAVVAVSMISLAVTKDQPRNLSVVAGAWEIMQTVEAEKALHLADPNAGLGQTVGDPAAGTGRRAVLAPSTEHVSVL